MQLDPYIRTVTEQLAAAAALGDERTQQVAAALATAAASAVRLATMSAISATADEINAALLDTPAATGITVSVHLENDEPAIRVNELPGADGEHAATADAPADGDYSARISLRLPEQLKADVEAGAARESISVNTWLVRAARAGLAGRGGMGNGPGGRGGMGGGRNMAGSPHNNHHITGWVTG